jgi:regulator of protease activity HflC (stomatin/prohibitin superfamily)
MADPHTMTPTRETPAGGPGGGVFALVFLLIALGVALLLTRSPPLALCAVFVLVGAMLLAAGLYALQPNEAAAVTQFGRYLGTDHTPGLRWTPFWRRRRKVSMRVRNVTSERLKVNDKQGNPVEIAANILWRVSDSARALFDVEDFTAFVNIQIETALREVTRQYAYDHGEEAEPTLRADADAVSERLRDDLRARVAVAGITVDEAHLMHLAYAPEIAGAMLRRQQAQAVIAARRLIVTGAVSMVDTALKQLGELEVVTLDEERKAAMVSNLLVVLCGDRDAQPVLNTGTLYA